MTIHVSFLQRSLFTKKCPKKINPHLNIQSTTILEGQGDTKIQVFMPFEKQMVVILRPFHTMLFISTVGYLMKTFGLSAILNLIYTDHTANCISFV